MNTSQKRQEISSLTRKVDELRGWHERLTRAREIVLTTSRDPQSEFDRERIACYIKGSRHPTYRYHGGATTTEANGDREIAALIQGYPFLGQKGAVDLLQEAADLQERIDLLTASLPTAAEIEEAERQMEELRGNLSLAKAEFHLHWLEYLEAMDAADQAAREVSAARSLVKREVDRLFKHAENFGLDIGSAREGIAPDGRPEVSSPIAVAIVEILRQCAHSGGGVDADMMRNVDKRRPTPAAASVSAQTKSFSLPSPATGRLRYGFNPPAAFPPEHKNRIDYAKT